jgi:hypothetical protein
MQYRAVSRRRRPAWLALGLLGPFAAGDALADEVVGVSGEGPSEAPSLGAAAGLASTDDPHHFELTGHTAYTMAPVRGGTNPFGLGFGARLGFVVSHVYVGGLVVGYLGGTDVDTSETALLLGGEVGYDLGTRLGDGWLTLRPQLGVGMVTITRTDPSLLATSSSSTSSVKVTKPDVVTQATPAPVSSGSSGSAGTITSSGGSSSSAPSDSVSVSNVYVQPGVTLMYSFGSAFAGVNGNLMMIPGLNYGGYQTSWFVFGMEGRFGLRW